MLTELTELTELTNAQLAAGEVLQPDHPMLAC